MTRFQNSSRHCSHIFHSGGVDAAWRRYCLCFNVEWFSCSDEPVHCSGRRFQLNLHLGDNDGLSFG